MNAAERRRFFRRAGLVVWAMATLVLVFVIGLLVYTMLSQNQNPLALAEKLAPQAAPEPEGGAAPRLRTKDVKLYFASADGRSLAPETRQLEFTDYTVENCRKAMQALMLGPSTSDGQAAVLPPSTKVRALYFMDDGELVVDLSEVPLGQQRNAMSMSGEALMVYAVVNTLTQPSLRGDGDVSIKTVRFLFEGSAPQESLSTHLDLAAPIAPDPSWIAGADPAGRVSAREEERPLHG